MVWPDLSYRYRDATDFLTSLTCLSSVFIGFHFSLIACFTYESEADLIALGGYFAARCTNVFIILLPLLLALLESSVKITTAPSSSTRLVCRFTSVVACDA